LVKRVADLQTAGTFGGESRPIVPPGRVDQALKTAVQTADSSDTGSDP
jgi:hypothetical protein